MNFASAGCSAEQGQPQNNQAAGASQRDEAASISLIKADETRWKARIVPTAKNIQTYPNHIGGLAES